MKGFEKSTSCTEIETLALINLVYCNLELNDLVMVTKRMNALGSMIQTMKERADNKILNDILDQQYSYLEAIICISKINQLKDIRSTPTLK